MKVDFYHLTIVPLDRALPQIADKVLAAGDRLLIVVADDAERERLDRHLWTWSADSFLPHAQIGASDDADQPILLASAVDAANRARNVALADGRWRPEVLDFDRAFHFFDDERIAEARAAWRSLGEREGVESRYWKHNEAGRWELAHQRGTG
jgi:DNA polymerase III subunit chi